MLQSSVIDGQSQDRLHLSMDMYRTRRCCFRAFSCKVLVEDKGDTVSYWHLFLHLSHLSSPSLSFRSVKTQVSLFNTIVLALTLTSPHKKKLYVILLPRVWLFLAHPVIRHFKVRPNLLHVNTENRTYAIFLKTKQKYIVILFQVGSLYKFICGRSGNISCCNATFSLLSKHW